MKTAMSTVWTAIQSSTDSTVSSLKSSIEQKWLGLKSSLESSMSSIQSSFTEKWESIRSTVEEKASSIQNNAGSAFRDLNQTLGSITGDLKSSVSSAWNDMASNTSNAMSNLQNTVSNGFNSMKYAVEGTMSGMQWNIENTMRNATWTVQNAMNSIRSSTSFSWNLPYLPMPHIWVTGYWSFDPPRVPSFEVHWYKDAMEKGAILNSATIFGMMNGKLLGGGEAGSETIVGTSSLMDMIRNAVSGMANMQTVNYGGVTVNVYASEGMDVKALADEIEERISLNIIRRRAGFA